MFEVPATIKDTDIPVCAGFRNSVNIHAITILGVDYAPRMIRYLGHFAAVDVSTRKYVGVHKFETLDSDVVDHPANNFAMIPGLTGDRHDGLRSQSDIPGDRQGQDDRRDRDQDSGERE